MSGAAESMGDVDDGDSSSDVPLRKKRAQNRSSRPSPLSKASAKGKGRAHDLSEEVSELEESVSQPEVCTKPAQ